MSERPSIIAAIPNYNMSERLLPLLRQLVNQPEPYDHIYVLDDASTDHSQDVVRDFGHEVTLVKNKVNVGSGANRNRIFSVTREKARTMVHFLDADVELHADHEGTPINPVPAIAEELLYRHDRTAFVGGLVTDTADKQLAFNYGAYYSMQAQIGGVLQMLSYDRPGLRRHFEDHLRDFPNPTEDKLSAKPVHWVSEANMLVDVSVLARMGGFDEGLRDHDIQPLARQVRRQGFTNYFNPSFGVTHHSLQVRSGNRELKKRVADLRLIRKYYGWREFFLPEGSFYPPKPGSNSRIA
jgi:N-acetylglucosaminyl-diphospho-decaprenol L-rhamnosyltransferase